MTFLFNRTGFTLIELLVVVLIIGILAAIALPQYRLAVGRSRFANAKRLSYTVLEAQRAYHLTNGEYATRFDQLDVDLGGTPKDSEDKQRDFDWGYCRLVFTSSGAAYVRCQSNLKGSPYTQFYFKGSLTKSCVVYNTDPDSLGNKICRLETGKATAGYKTDDYWSWSYPVKF